jgi:6-phosphogluconolactonase (cycloisomerase 2 family)
MTAASRQAAAVYPPTPPRKVSSDKCPVIGQKSEDKKCKKPLRSCSSFSQSRSCAERNSHLISLSLPLQMGLPRLMTVALSWGETYTAGLTGVLWGVSVDVRSTSSFPLHVAIRTVAGRLPTTTILGEVTLSSSASDLSQVIVFPQSIPQVAGVQYAIVVNYPGAPPEGPAHVQGLWDGATGNLYSGGDLFLSSDGGASFFLAGGGFDVHFKTFVSSVGHGGGAQPRTHQYLYTNNNAFNGNSTTALELSASGSAKVIDTYRTGGSGPLGDYFALVPIASAHVGPNSCLFVSNGGDNTIAAFTVDKTNGTLTTVPGSPFASGVTGVQQFGVGLAVGDNKLLFAGNTQFNSISELKISSTCELKAVGTINVPGAPVGLKVTPNGKFLIVSYLALSPPQPPSVTSLASSLGQVDSFAINYTSGLLTELGRFNAQGHPAGIDINCDNSLVYFGDAASETQVEVFSLSSSGVLTEVNNFINSNSVNSNNVQLNKDDLTLYVSNTMSNQITALSTSSDGGLTYGTTTMLNGSPVFALGLATSRKGTYIFVSEGDGIGILSVDGTTVKEVPGSPLPLINNGSDVPALVAFPTKMCK